MRSRPDIDLRLPPVVHPGEDVTIEVVATSGSDTPIDFFDVTFSGSENVTSRADMSLRPKPVVHTTVRLRDEGVLTQGEHRFIARFTVPLDAPPSYLGVLASIRYEVRIHVSIPWWPDLRETYELLVETRPGVRPKPSPASTTSSGGHGEPFLELSVSDTAFGVGDEVSGAFAAGNLARQAGEDIVISLVAMERSHDGARSQRAEQFRYNAPNVFRVPRGGREAPFRFRVPKDALPSFESPRCRLEWALLAVLPLSSLSSVVCSIPVVIGRYAGSRPGAARYPEIGAARWREGWSEIGERYGLALGEDRFALVGRRGAVQIEVDVYESDDEAALAATFRYPSIMLGLRAAPQLLVMLPSPLELRFPGHKIEHRELDQARAFLDGPLREALERVKLTSADDTSLRVRAAVAGYDEESVDPFLRCVAAIADALGAAIEAIPPPAVMRDALPAWRDLAAATGARLTVGGMALHGVGVDGELFDVWTRLGPRGEVTGTRVELRVDPPLALRAPLDAAVALSFAWTPPGCHELAETLRASVERLDIQSEIVAVELPGATPDPAALRPTMALMIALAQRLRGERSAGPYR